MAEVFDRPAFGPAMAALDQRRQNFVQYFLDLGGKEGVQGEAARQAGYSPGPEVVLYHRVQACRLLQDDRILAALHEESVKRMKYHGYSMFRVASELALDPKAPPAVRLKAACEVMDRVGMHAISEHKVTVDDMRSRAEMLAELLAVVREAGVDLGVLVPRRAGGAMIDVTPKGEGDG